jgi:hypothetical protein
MPPFKLPSKLDAVVRLAVSDKIKSDDGKDDISCTGVTLANVDGANHLEEVFTLQLTGALSAKEVAATLQSRADLFASGQTDSCKFVVHFFYGDDTPRRPFYFTTVSMLAAGEHGMEEASAKALAKTAVSAMQQTLAITFEHQIEMQRASVALLAGVTRQLEIANAKQERTREELDAAIDHIVGLRMAAQDKTHELRKAELDKLDKGEMMSKLLEYGPALLNSITGKKVFPESTADSALLKGVLAALEKADPQVLMTLAGILPPEVMAPLAQRAQGLKQEQEMKKAARERALSVAAEIEVPLEMGEGTANEPH